LEGKPVAEKIKEELKHQIALLKDRPVLASVVIGDNPGAEAYAKSQAKTAESLGIIYQLHKLSPETSEGSLIDFIGDLNSQAVVNGIIVQLPLPQQIDYRKIGQYILPAKDVEGLHPANIGRIPFGQAGILPCTAAAVMELLKASGVDLYGRETVVVGHSEIVGKPLALLLLDKFATVTVCHIATWRAGKLQEHVQRAEVLIVAVGKAGLIKGDWIKEKAVVIDVGINRLAGKIVGDVEFAEASQRAGWITPVPGGVGPLTVTILMRNLLEAVKLQGRQ
jgi:methylenetetrahydrofolate dehydrogenase (NADP+)/methenyltetrahydrofolate cyclohydrolase